MSEPTRHPLLAAREGDTPCLLGNEAIVRGALEAGVAFACGYPGTPSSEVTDTFGKLADEAGIVFEYSVNEKIALEMAFAASLAGARSICAMKHLGLMAAGDPLSTIPYIGVEAGMVIMSAGDPSCRTSPNEQDQRRLGPLLHIPVLDPSTPAEALEMTRFAFELSEKTRLPVLLRATTRVCHSRATVTCASLRRPEVHGFKRNPPRYVPIPQNARRMRLEINDRMATAEAMISDSPFFRKDGDGNLVVLATGAPAAACADVLSREKLRDRVAFWRLGAVHPLPEKQLVESLRGVERLLVVEELSPYLEERIRSLCSVHGLHVEVLGKQTGHLREEFELEPATLSKVLRELLGLAEASVPSEPAPRSPPSVPPRPPSLCPGCTHRAAFFAVRTAFDEDQLYFNDIGCYTLGYGAPLNTADAVLCMGAGFTLAAGASRVTGQRTVGFMGDGTFFHAGIPALLNANLENVNMVAVILDNRVTAMTGFQRSPTTANASIEGIVRSLGVDQVEKIDPYDLPRAVEAFGRARDATGLSVVIVERACPVHTARQEPAQKPGPGPVVADVPAKQKPTSPAREEV